MVTRRLVPLVLALALALAPVALEACQATCARQASAATAPTAVHHSCHEMASPHPAGGAEVRGVPHNCAHTGDLPTACGTLWQSGPSAPAVVPVLASYRAPTHRAPIPFDTAPSFSPPLAFSAGQLRV